MKEPVKVAVDNYMNKLDREGEALEGEELKDKVEEIVKDMLRGMI